MPQMIRLFMTAVLSLSLNVNYPAVSYYWATGKIIQVKMKIVQQIPRQTPCMECIDVLERQTSQGKSTTILKLASHVKQTMILTGGVTWGSEYWWIKQATQSRAPTICKATSIQNIFISNYQIQIEILKSSILLLMHHYTKSSHVEALSIHHQQCQRNKGKKPDRKHILALLSSFTREEVQVKREQIEELCCFDRMKKFIGGIDQLQVEGQKNQIRSIVIEQKINEMESKLAKQVNGKPLTPKLHQRAASSGNFHRKSIMIDSLKKDCLQKFISHQVGKRDREIDDAKKMIDKEVKSQIDNLIQDKGLQMMKLKEDNESLKKRILTLNLEVQALKVKENQMKEYIEELQEISKGKKETKKSLTQSQSNQSFQDKFRQCFGDCTIEQIRRRLDLAIDKCLSGFQKVQNRNQFVMAEQKRNFQQEYSRMQKRIDQLQNNENELLGNLRTLKLNKQLSEVEADELGRAKVELQRLQKLILALYTDWYAQREESQKKLLKARGCLHENYSYEEMLKYIVEYNKKYSTDQKLNDYLFKVLRGIQKLRRTIYPEQCNEKLDPLATLDRIEKWVKFRVQVPNLIKKSTNAQTLYMTQQ